MSSATGPGPAYDFNRSAGSGPSYDFKRSSRLPLDNNTQEGVDHQHHPSKRQVETDVNGNSRSNEMLPAPTSSNAGESLDYSSVADSSHMDGDSESYLAINTLADSSIITGHVANYHTLHADATNTVHEMHLALLYLLSNPEEFQKALSSHPARGATTLAEWNAEYDNESMTEGESITTAENYTAAETAETGSATPLPFVVFADDAEVVLPQAHTASQLFGVERLEGIELEAAAGIPALSQLFLRWLALMPGGDHLNIIDPPGLTVMRIAGGRYRVTAAHRVVWTWMNEFANLTDPHRSPNEHSNDESVNTLQVDDLVSMTIVDVFETDNQGKLLSYCPTFDNRAVVKTHAAAENWRKSSHKLMSMFGQAQKSQTAAMIMKNARSMAVLMRYKMDEAVHTYNSPQRRAGANSQDLELQAEMNGSSATSRLGQAVNLNVTAAEQVAKMHGQSVSGANFLGEDDTERHEI